MKPRLKNLIYDVVFDVWTFQIFIERTDEVDLIVQTHLD